jgi:hypothetical protein
MNGAVQGVATIVARMPVKNVPASPERAASRPPTPPSAPPKPATPERLNPIAKRRYASTATKTGDCS